LHDFFSSFVCSVFVDFEYYIIKVEKNQLLYHKKMPMKPAHNQFHYRLLIINQEEKT